MDIDPQIFLDVPLNENQPHRCSPSEPAPSWRGVVITAPTRVRFKKGDAVGPTRAFAAIPICGYFRADIRLDRPRQPMRLVAINLRTADEFTGPIVDLDSSPSVPDPDAQPVRAEDVKGLVGGGYFNPNLADYVALPQTSGAYRVHVEWNEFRSNEVTVDLVEETGMPAPR